MAARKRTQTKVIRSTTKPVIIRETVAPRRRRAAAPIVVAQRGRVTHHRRRVGSASGAITPMRLATYGLGGLIYGFVEKQFPKLPSIPGIGKAGTITIGAYLLSKHSGIAPGIFRDVAVAGAVMSGYQLGKEGKISGDVDGAFEEV